jgi:hypothetical protein
MGASEKQALHDDLRQEESRRRRIEQAMAVYATDDETRLLTDPDETTVVTGPDGLTRVETDETNDASSAG